MNSKTIRVIRAGSFSLLFVCVYNNFGVLRMSKSEKNPSTVVSSLQSSPKDTGTSEVQIAFLTSRIEQLTSHFKAYPKDFSGRRGLLGLVSQRRSLLNYLKKKKPSNYEALLGKLGLRH